jgi:hypothetical protein
MSGQGHFLDLCPVPTVRQPKPRRTAREKLAEPPRYEGASRDQVLQYITQCGTFGATDEEVQVQIPMPANTQRPRRIELVRRGLVVDSGRTRRTASGVAAVVWIDAKQLEASQ